jgi:hypothetical protein
VAPRMRREAAPDGGEGATEKDKTAPVGIGAVFGVSQPHRALC